MEQKNWFVAERAKALATIYITNRDDLDVRPGSEREFGVDFIVDIKNPPNNGFRRFGFLLCGSRRHITKADADKTLTVKLKRWRDWKFFPFPVTLFYFSALDDTGFFTWIAEPVILEGTPRLRHVKEAHSQPLDRESLDRIVASVNDWYDVFYATLIV